MMPIIIAIHNSENFGKYLINFLVFFLNKFLTISPSINGNIVIQNVVLTKDKKLISICFFVKKKNPKWC